MKIALGSKYLDGPYGGGNLFIKNIRNLLTSEGHEIVYDLLDDDIDIILLTNPLIDSEHSTFSHLDIIYYQKFVNPNSISIQRINECDERKNTKNVNKQIIKSNSEMDYTIFVSSWLKNLYKDQGMDVSHSKVILSGSDNNFFNRNLYSKWDRNEKIKLVTHHWSNNWMKGFKTYLAIDKILDKDEWNKRIEFTYIGNIPKDLSFKNTTIIEPLGEKELANELKKHNLYITGSINEPSGNHHIEAAQCGLPILYINSGGVTEYCKDYGIEFNDFNLEEKINEIIEQYEVYEKKMETYPLSSEKMGQEFLLLFSELLSKKISFIKKRKNVSKFKIYIHKFLWKLNRIYYLLIIKLNR